MKTENVKKEIKLRIKRGDKVRVTTGKDKGKEGKILVVDRKNNKVIVEGVNMVTRHTKANKENQSGGIIKKEGKIAASNVMFLHKGQTTRIGYMVERKEIDGKTVNIKYRIAKNTGEVID